MARMDYDIPEMLQLRVSGMSYSALGRLYSKDHTTIMHHCRKYGAYPGGITQEEWENIRHVQRVEFDEEEEEETKDIYTEKRVPVVIKYAHLMFEKINRGKRSHHEYMMEAMKDPAYQHYAKHVGFEKQWRWYP